MSTAARAADLNQPAVLYDIDWATYTRLLRAFEKAHRRLYLTYDRGTLEILSPLLEHENPAELLGAMIAVLTEELNLPRRAGGSVTLRRQRKKRGLEPDRCFWIASAPLLQGKTRLDLRTDPPPDLAIEVDVTRRSLDRMGIYAALAVPEVWRLSKAILSIHLLEADKYVARANSKAFPALAAADLAPFLEELGQSDDAALIRKFRAWVRQELLPRQAGRTGA